MRQGVYHGCSEENYILFGGHDMSVSMVVANHIHHWPIYFFGSVCVVRRSLSYVVNPHVKESSSTVSSLTKPLPVDDERERDIYIYMIHVHILHRLIYIYDHICIYTTLPQFLGFEYLRPCKIYIINGLPSLLHDLPSTSGEPTQNSDTS